MIEAFAGTVKGICIHRAAFAILDAVAATPSTVESEMKHRGYYGSLGRGDTR